MVLSSFRRALRKALPDANDIQPSSEAGVAAAPLFPVPQERVLVSQRDAPSEEVRAAAPAPKNGPAVTPPVVIVRPLGAMANRMIQHMTAMKIAALAPGTQISRVHLPEWGIDQPDLPDVVEPAINFEHMRVDVEGAAAALREGRAKSVAISGYAQHMENLLAPEAYRQLFSSDIDVESHGDDTLLINIRAAEILSGQYPPYVLIPIAFYQQIVRETGLKPVFFGQLSDCPYMDELRAAFPDARFRHGNGVIHDWEVLRRSKNVCMSVSTFSWAACWLSEAHRIFMPMTGLLNPVHGALYEGGHNLVPTNDNRYLFYQFPLNAAVSQDRYREVHKAIEGNWRLVSGAWVTTVLERRQHLQRLLDDYVAVFDEEHYLRVHPELGMAKQNGWISDGLSHYKMHGFTENRWPCHIDMEYAHRYPDAGTAVSNGEFIDLLHFHAERGRHLGYMAVSG